MMSDEFVAETCLPDSERRLGPDALEAFIGSGHSGRPDLARSHRDIIEPRLTRHFVTDD